MNAVLPETHQIGANGPPEPTTREALTTHLSDLLAEAHNWADGTEVYSQEQADEASRLIDELRKGANAAEEQRKAEKKPHDDAAAEVQAFWGTWIADPKTKNPGKVWKAIDALKACVKPYLDRLEAERQEAARKAREEAEAAARAAAEAARAAAASDLAAQEAAEDLIRAAEQAEADAKRIENAKSQARGGERALGLRKIFVAVMTDRKAALLHYVAQQPEAFVDLLQRLADQDVRAGKRQIPGFTVEQRTAL